LGGMFGTCMQPAGCTNCLSKYAGNTVKVQLEVIEALKEKENCIAGIHLPHKREMDESKSPLQTQGEKQCDEPPEARVVQDQKHVCQEQGNQTYKENEELNSHKGKQTSGKLHAELLDQEQQYQPSLQASAYKHDGYVSEAVAKRLTEVEERRLKFHNLHYYLGTGGFKDVNHQKQTSRWVSSGFTYPLHAAVRTNNLEFVQLLLWAGADATFQDSSKLTPAELCLKLNKKGSHRRILAALSKTECCR